MSSKDQSLSLAERIYRARGADLLRYLRRRVRSDADARDIAQEAFLRFLRLADTDRLTTPEAYLFRIAGNLLWERRLREQGETENTPSQDVQIDEHTPFDFALAEQEVARLRVALESLPQLQRAILMLHLRDNLSFSQIATSTGITTSLAKKLYYKALAGCREQLAELNADQGRGP